MAAVSRCRCTSRARPRWRAAARSGASTCTTRCGQSAGAIGCTWPCRRAQRATRLLRSGQTKLRLNTGCSLASAGALLRSRASRRCHQPRPLVVFGAAAGGAAAAVAAGATGGVVAGESSAWGWASASADGVQACDGGAAGCGGVNDNARSTPSAALGWPVALAVSAAVSAAVLSALLSARSSAESAAASRARAAALACAGASAAAAAAAAAACAAASVAMSASASANGSSAAGGAAGCAGLDGVAAAAAGAGRRAGRGWATASASAAAKASASASASAAASTSTSTSTSTSASSTSAAVSAVSPAAAAGVAWRNGGATAAGTTSSNSLTVSGRAAVARPWPGAAAALGASAGVSLANGNTTAPMLCTWVGLIRRASGWRLCHATTRASTSLRRSACMVRGIVGPRRAAYHRIRAAFQRLFSCCTSAGKPLQQQPASAAGRPITCRRSWAHHRPQASPRRCSASGP